MKNCIKKLVSSLLTLIMLLSLLPASTLAADTDTVAITVSTDETRGTVTGGGTYAIGDTVTLTATAKDGYIFDGWYEDGIKLYLPKGTFIAERDRILEARFKIAVKAANGRKALLFTAFLSGVTAVSGALNCGKSHFVSPLANCGLTHGKSRPISPLDLPNPQALNLTAHLPASLINGAVTVLTALTERVLKNRVL